MPVDIHQGKISGVEFDFDSPACGRKFNDKTYQHAGGLHGVGVSVVNALSKHWSAGCAGAERNTT